MEQEQLIAEIKRLKKEKNAVILAHYYVTADIQELADYIGDSFYLSKVAVELKEKFIIFAGVNFMGESAKLLNEEKRVFLPDMDADCPMAHMVDVEKIEKMRAEYPDLCVVCYINSTAEIKTCADVCVTSANAVKIVKNLPNQNIFFIPDGNLGSYVKEQVPEKNIMVNDGFCPIHHNLTKEMVLAAKKEHPGALFLVHPECTPDVLEEADYIGSTSGIIQFAGESQAQEFIIGTESGVFYKLQQENPEKKFYLANSNMVCVNMKKVTLEKILAILETECNEVFLPDGLKEKAMAPLEKMLEYAK